MAAHPYARAQVMSHPVGPGHTKRTPIGSKRPSASIILHTTGLARLSPSKSSTRLVSGIVFFALGQNNIHTSVMSFQAITLTNMPLFHFPISPETNQPAIPLSVSGPSCAHTFSFIRNPCICSPICPIFSSNFPFKPGVGLTVKVAGLIS